MDAFQDAIPNNHCFGCGPLNPHGLQIRSRWRDAPGGAAVCAWTPQPHHMAGPVHLCNGGIIATVIDCHCICTAIADAYRREGRAVGSAPEIWYATGRLSVDYRAPAPLDAALELHAEFGERTERKTVLRCRVTAAGVTCADAEVVAVRVAAAWRESPAPH